jgi:hypothetical protein
MLVLSTLFGMYPCLQKLFADGGYQGPVFEKSFGQSASAPRNRNRQTASPMSQSLPRSSPISQARFMPIAPTTPCRSIEAAGGTSKLMRKGHRWLPAEKLEAHNPPPPPIRASVAGLSTNSFFIASCEGICLETPCSLARIENIFGTWKHSCHFRSMRWIGLAKARSQVHLAALPTTSNAIGGCKAPERI